jgi:hypothetical protein
MRFDKIDNLGRESLHEPFFEGIYLSSRFLEPLLPQLLKIEHVILVIILHRRLNDLQHIVCVYLDNINTNSLCKHFDVQFSSCAFLPAFH